MAFTLKLPPLQLSPGRCVLLKCKHANGIRDHRQHPICFGAKIVQRLTTQRINVILPDGLLWLNALLRAQILLMTQWIHTDDKMPR